MNDFQATVTAVASLLALIAVLTFIALMSGALEWTGTLRAVPLHKRHANGNDAKTAKPPEPSGDGP